MMKTSTSVVLAMSGVLSFMTGATASAQDAVQWRVEDGGNGNWYAFIPDDNTYAGHFENAEAIGAHLITITSAEENAFAEYVRDLENSGGAYIAGGFRTGDGPDDWAWVTGEGWSYTNWENGEPTSFQAIGIRGQNDGTWEALATTTEWYAIYEYSADCNGDGIVDYEQMLDGTLSDDNNNGIVDACEEGLVVPDDYATIQQAIDNAPVGSVVHVRAGVYEENLSYDHTVILRSIDGPNETIIDGTDSGTVATLTGPNGEPNGIRQVIDGFTIRNGRYNGVGGGGLLVSGGAVLTLRNCIVRDNIHEGSKYGGGGIRVESSSLHGIDCVFSGNQTNFNGAAIYFLSSCCNTLDGCLFEDEGKGDRFEYPALDIVHLQSGSAATITDCTFNRCEIQDSEIVLWVDCTASVTDTMFLDAEKPSDDSSGSIASGAGSTLSTERIVVCGHPEPYFTDINHSDLGGSIFSSPICDCNGDGLFDYGQILDGTLADDDRDGVPDLCDAVQWRVDDDGNGHWYRLFSAPGISWAEAEQHADDLSGHLSSLTSAEENGFVVSQFANGMTTMPWIGLRQDNDGDWGWNTGETYAWTNWSPTEPNGGSIEVEAIIWLTDAPPDRPLGTWNDYQTPHPNGGLIEWSADCNGDGIVDYGQILDGSVTDCNGNLVPDVCEISDTFAASVDRTPESITDFIEFDVSAMADANDTVTLGITAVGDLAGSGEFLWVYLDDMLLELVFVDDGAACEEVTTTLTMLATEWNDAGTDGSRLIKISGTNIDPDACADPRVGISVIVPIPFDDCDESGTWDVCDIASGLVSDLDGNGIPDSCDPDCDGDGEPDGYEISSGQALDCNANEIPDSCDIAEGGSSSDVDSDGVPDDCQPDCDGDGVPDSWELSAGLAMDCNENGYPDNCDILEGTSNDVDLNGVPDECKDDCNGNGIPDYWEIKQGDVADCDNNGIPDPCDIAAGNLPDCDNDLISDDCAIADGVVSDCNENGIPDSCDIADGFDEDDNDNGIPDGCELARGDLNLDGCINGADLAILLSLWGVPNPPIGDLNGDGSVNGSDLAIILGNWSVCP